MGMTRKGWGHLHAWTDDIDTVIAESFDDAWAVWCEYFGEKRENYKNDNGFSRLSRDLKWTITDSKGNTKTQTIRRWIIEQGRGFLSSTEY